MSALMLCLAALAADPVKPTPKEALQAVQSLVGTWKATGTPEGTREERQAGFWTEVVKVEWKFAADDVCLAFAHDGGKRFKTGELRYLPATATYELTVTTTDTPAATHKYAGPLTVGKQKEQVLTLDRDTDAETHRLVLTLLHGNRYVLRAESKPKAGSLFTKRFQVGATKEGEAFASVPKGVECIVSGGKGTMPVPYKGKTYYVCCSGCRDAFKDDPEKFIALAAKKE
jgi:YHS domain-containing protein